MKNLTVKNIIAACGGTFSGNNAVLEQEISFITTDSREAGPGCLFVAIRGERVDGHDYIQRAVELGAQAVLCEHVPENMAGNLICVSSSLQAVKDIARFYRAQFDIPVIGIVGSVGKTTAKEMVASVLSQRFSVLKTQGNFNNELGVPLTLFRLTPEHQIAVIEMGISDFGEMTRLAQIARPDMAVFTIVGCSHLEQLHDRLGVLRAKSEILDYIPAEGTVFLNGDDDLLHALHCRQHKVEFGLDKSLDIYAEDVHNLPEGGMGCDLVAGSRRFPVEIPAFGAHMIYAALEGAAVGIHFGLTDAEIQAGIRAFETVGFRARLENTGYITIVNDCYNSNPTSASSAIVSMGTFSGRKVCILGDMLELGERSDIMHRELGAFAAESGCAMVIACGKQARYIYEGARTHSNAPLAWYFEEKEALLESLPMLIHAGDAVLVKASRGMKFEEIVEALKRLH